MNPIYRFCFKPTPQDRYAWAWIQAILAFLLSLTVLLLLSRGQYLWAGWNAFWMLLNVFLCYVNHMLYLEWKNNQRTP